MPSVMHPREKDLALLAGSDARRWQRFTLDRHVRACTECQEKVAQFRQLRAAIAMVEPPSVNWSLLEAEMRANIHLGFEAGQCVRGVRTGWVWEPRLGVALACLLLLAGASFFLRGPHALTAQKAVTETAAVSPVSESPVLESTNSGLELRSSAGSLTLLNHHGVIAHQTVSARGEIRARYVDGNAGTVTINNVYLQ
jgi:hypothetical protein